MIRMLVSTLIAAAAVLAAAHLPLIWLAAAAAVVLGVVGTGRVAS